MSEIYRQSIAVRDDAPIAKEREIPAAVGQLQQNVSVLQKAIEELEDRLNPVLQLVTAQPKEPSAPPRAASSTSLAGAIMTISDTIVSIGRKLDSLRTRVEL